MKRMYSESQNWDKKHWKKSFENLKNDGYSFDKIKVQNWFSYDGWQLAVLSNKTAHKKIDESEKAVKFSVVNQYGNMYDMWLPKKALISY